MLDVGTCAETNIGLGVNMSVNLCDLNKKYKVPIILQQNLPMSGSIKIRLPVLMLVRSERWMDRHAEDNSPKFYNSSLLKLAKLGPRVTPRTNL
jgi:hypothetical protein